jgi:hypothetical protein
MDFVKDRYSLPERRRRKARAEQTPWRRRARWLRKFEWPARVVIVVAEVEVAYTLFVADIVLGLVLRFAIT